MPLDDVVYHSDIQEYFNNRVCTVHYLNMTKTNWSVYAGYMISICKRVKINAYTHGVWLTHVMFC